MVSNSGNLFYKWNSVDSFAVAPNGYEYLFSGYLGVGGYDGDELRMTGQPYWPFMLPGPLGEDGMPAAGEACAALDRVYKVSRQDLWEGRGETRPSDAVLEWPAALGAPVVDGDGDVTNYNPFGGDRPALIGDQMAWWVMNDGGRAHLSGREGARCSRGDRNCATRRLGFEAGITAAIFKSGPDLQLSLFRYHLTYRGEGTLDSAVVYVFLDAQAGYWDDDAGGSDSTSNLGYVYNVKPDRHLGGETPAVGLQLLRGPLVDKDGLDNDGDGVVDEAGEELGAVTIGVNSEVNEYKESPGGFHLAYHGCYRFQEMIYGLGCAQSEGNTRFEASGNPVSGEGWVTTRSHYRQIIVSSGPFTWVPGHSQTIEFAVIWEKGKSNLDAVDRIIGRAPNLIAGREILFEPDVSRPRPDPPEPPADYMISRVHPDPTDGLAKITFELPNPTDITLSVYDIMGRRVARSRADFSAGTHDLSIDVSRFPTGAYFYRLDVGRGYATGRFDVRR